MMTESTTEGNIKLEVPGTGNDAVAPSDEANNNSNDNRKVAEYDVFGKNDEELARRHYVDDEADDYDQDDRDDDLQQQPKRLATEDVGKRERSNSIDDSATNNSASNDLVHNGQADDSHSTNDNSIDDEYNHYSNNNNPEVGDAERRQRQQQQQQSLNQLTEEPEQLRKLFVGGLHFTTSEATLRDHFSMFGEVVDCIVMRDPQTKKSRGFGFVIYAASSMVDRAQEARPHEIDGREVQSKRAISREDTGKPETQATVKKAYLGGLSDDVEESELRDYFKDFGNIVSVQIAVQKDTGKRRGFAFIEFDDHDPVDKIVLKKFHTIKDKRIEAKKAVPKSEMDARRRVDPRMAMTSHMMGLPHGPPMDGPGGRSRHARGYGDGWEAPYDASSYSVGYSGQAGYSYPPHYNAPSAHGYGSNSWMMHGGQGETGGGSYAGFRGGHGSSNYPRGNYANPAAAPAGWSEPPVSASSEYGGFSSSHGPVGGTAGAGATGGGGGPMRLRYQHHSWGPYGNGYGNGAHRGRG